MAAGDLKFSKAAFVAGETVNLYAVDTTPGMPDISLAKSAVAAADGSAAFAGLTATVVQHGQTVKLICAGLGATSARRVQGIPD